MNAEAEGSGRDIQDKIEEDVRAEDAGERPLPLRPDMIERARLLLADPAYPGIEAARAISGTILPALK